LDKDRYEEREIPLKDLKKLISRRLTKKGKTIPEFQKSLKRKLGFYINEYAVMIAISELEDEGKAILCGFGDFYEPDGCQGFLARYGHP
jgi:hypothetical protein